MSDSQQGFRNLLNYVDKRSDQTIHICEATVEEVRKKDKRVRLALLPDGEEIGWVRMLILAGDGSWSTAILPPVNSTVIVLFPRGQKDMAVCLTGNLLEAGENGLENDSELDIVINDSRGNKIALKSGMIEITSQVLKYNNGTAPVARVGDFVSSPFGNLPIVTGNNNFLA